MKCTQCGNTSFIENVSFPYRAIDGGQQAKFYEIHVCDQCGHAEHFYLGPMLKKKELEKAQKEFQTKMDEQTRIINQFENAMNEIQEKIKIAIEKEKQRVNEILNNKNNTVLVYEKAKAELAVIENLKLEGKLELIGMSLDDYPDARQFKIAKRNMQKMEREYQQVVQEINRKYNW